MARLDSSSVLSGEKSVVRYEIILSTGSRAWVMKSRKTRGRWEGGIGEGREEGKQDGRASEKRRKGAGSRARDEYEKPCAWRARVGARARRKRATV
eukprot:2048400-Pleurochrysis_carterae.AAC.1